MVALKIEKDSSVKISPVLEEFLDPAFIYVPKALVVPKYVFKGQSFGGVYSSVSGVVVGEEKDFFVVQNDYREKRKTLGEKKSKILKNDFDSRFKDCKYIIINAINDEVYAINRVVGLKVRIEEILEFLDEIMQLFDVSKVIIAIKSIDMEIVEDCLDIVDAYSNVSISLLDDKYLLGRNEFLLRELNIRDNEAMCFLVDDFLKILDEVKYGRVCDTMLVTISGDALNEGKIFRIKKNIKLKDILDKVRDSLESSYVLVAGNLLNGRVVSEDFIIADDVLSIHVMKKKEFRTQKCIKCGACVDVCPVGVDPLRCLLEDKSDKRCIDCGLCSYVCPSYIPLRNWVTKDEE